LPRPSSYVATLWITLPSKASIGARSRPNDQPTAATSPCPSISSVARRCLSEDVLRPGRHRLRGWRRLATSRRGAGVRYAYYPLSRREDPLRPRCMRVDRYHTAVFFQGYVMDRRIDFIEEKARRPALQHTLGTSAMECNPTPPLDSTHTLWNYSRHLHLSTTARASLNNPTAL
jgi:hypothetical protein